MKAVENEIQRYNFNFDFVCSIADSILLMEVYILILVG